ncbi:hypothetical protein LAD12857_09220 [Lacrimispora amygdalina]|uniref:Uncharacterized protein n=1 Tax=Lacrimispora amygdalina TaxID=253257 RepID=A0ABQ5M300_9FIRM
MYLAFFQLKCNVIIGDDTGKFFCDMKHLNNVVHKIPLTSVPIYGTRYQVNKVLNQKEDAVRDQICYDW